MAGDEVVCQCASPKTGFILSTSPLHLDALTGESRRVEIKGRRVDALDRENGLCESSSRF